MRFLKVQTKPHHTGGVGIHHDLPEGMVRPGHVKMFVNLVGSIGKVAYETMNGRPVTVPPEVYRSRLDICLTCPAFDTARSICLKCGCAANKKLHLAAMVCPWKEGNRPAPKWGSWPN